MKKPVLSLTLAFLFALIAFPSLSQADTVVFNDDFTGTIANSNNWHIPTWTSATDGTYIPRTQMRVTQSSPLPTASNGNVIIPVQSFNPSGSSFYGTDLISNKTFSVGEGLDIKIKAKMNSPLRGGTVGGIFLYSLLPGSDTIHDEIDFEILGNKPGQVQTNIYGNEPLGAGNSSFVNYPSGSATDYHIYEIKWLPNQVSWYVDGTLVRTENTHIPTNPMYVHLNMWVPSEDWANAYDSTLTIANTASANQIFSMSVDSVVITSLSNTPTPVLKTISLTPTTATLDIGKTTQISASTLDQNGSAFSTTLTWSSSNTSVATVNSSGLVTAVSAGTANITASSGGITSNTSVVTVNKPISNINIQITSVPKLGANGNAKGKVTGLTKTTYSKYRVAVYIKVAGGWWNKPYFTSAATKITSSYTWTADITTGGNDKKATEIRAYLVPINYPIPASNGLTAIPSSLDIYPYATITR
jgi:beta-glucanase (GH16 family)